MCDKRTNLYVVGLPGDIKYDDVMTVFGWCGPVNSVRVLENKFPAPTHSAMVRMKTHEGARNAIARLSGKPVPLPPFLNSTPIRIRFAKNSTPPTQSTAKVPPPNPAPTSAPTPKPETKPSVTPNEPPVATNYASTTMTPTIDPAAQSVDTSPAKLSEHQLRQHVQQTQLFFQSYLRQPPQTANLGFSS
jgi:RNA recognition motif-containing protein